MVTKRITQECYWASVGNSKAVIVLTLRDFLQLMTAVVLSFGSTRINKRVYWA
jgi:hypothetical protein